MTLHPIYESDSERLREVWNSAASFDQMGAGLLHEKLWGDADYDSELAVAFADGGQIRGFGMAVCRPLKHGLVGFVKLLAVRPAEQRSGIGQSICNELETRCRGRGAVEMRVGESAPNYLVPGVDKRYKAATAFFQQMGYVPTGDACNMRVDLNQWQEQYRQALTSDAKTVGVEVVRASRSQEIQIREFIDRYWPPWWGEVATALSNEPTTLFVAIDAGEIVGFVAHEANNRGTGWFGPMGTAPSHRGCGIGAQLLGKCLGDMREAGNAMATIPWVGPQGFYSRLAGAVVDREFIRFSKPLA